MKLAGILRSAGGAGNGGDGAYDCLAEVMINPSEIKEKSARFCWLQLNLDTAESRFLDIKAKDFAGNER